MKHTLKLISFVAIFNIVAIHCLAQQAFSLCLHFYEPLSKNRQAFEDSVLTFFQVYEKDQTAFFPVIKIFREDYGAAYKEKVKFMKSEETRTYAVGVERTKQEWNAIAKDIADVKLRETIPATPILAMKLGVFRYACEIDETELNNEERSSFFYVPKANKKNEFSSIENLKKAMLAELVVGKSKEMHVYFGNPSTMCKLDETYATRTISNVTYDYAGNLTVYNMKLVRQIHDSLVSEMVAKKQVPTSLMGEGVKLQTVELEVLTLDQAKERIFNNPRLSNVRFEAEPFLSQEVKISMEGIVFKVVVSIVENREGQPQDELGFATFYVSLNSEGKVRAIKNTAVMWFDSATAGNAGFDSNAVFTFVEKNPIYPGGDEGMMNDLARSIVYPSMEEEQGIAGVVYVSFVVEKNGSVSNVQVLRGVNGGPGLSKAAMEAVKQLKRFAPGRQNGRAVRVEMKIPVRFVLKQ